MKNLKALLILFPVLLTTQAFAAGNACKDLLSGEKIMVSQAGEKFVYETHGQAESSTVVIFLSGLDKDMHQWDRTRKVLEPKRPNALYVQLDLLGQGKTAALNSNGDTIPFEKQVSALDNLIAQNNWKGKRIVLVSHSYGGGIAARYVSEHPGVVSDAVLIAPYVDNLETHQIGAGPFFLWSKTVAKMMGLGKVYDETVLANSEIAMMTTWHGYKIFNGAKNSLKNVMALTRGNRDLQMNKAVENAGSTKLHLVLSSMDEMIPLSGHVDLWNHVPQAARGSYTVLISSHDSVYVDPATVARQVERVL